jgi:hypothetical protein
MDPQPVCDKQIEIVYKYFSHHIRTNTAVIVAMLEAINDGLTDDSATSMIMESGFLLDLFDRGMSVCFNHILRKAESSSPESVNLFKLISLFIDNGMSKESGCTADISIPQDTAIQCEPYSFKSLILILMHESALAAQSGLNIEFRDDTLKITPDSGFYENPPILEIFSEIFAKQGFHFEYNNNFFLLRFTNESINS